MVNTVLATYNTKKNKAWIIPAVTQHVIKSSYSDQGEENEPSSCLERNKYMTLQTEKSRDRSKNVLFANALTDTRKSTQNWKSKPLGG